MNKLCNFRYESKGVRSNGEEGPAHCSVSMPFKGIKNTSGRKVECIKQIERTAQGLALPTLKLSLDEPSCRTGLKTALNSTVLTKSG